MTRLRRPALVRLHPHGRKAEAAKHFDRLDRTRTQGNLLQELIGLLPADLRRLVRESIRLVPAASILLFGWLLPLPAEGGIQSRSTRDQSAEQESLGQESLSDLSGPKLYPGLTGYTRSVTCKSTEVQRWFDQGIQLLYGFNHDEAIRSFEHAAAMDPDCAMAWWGVAYARGLHINNPQMTEQQSRLAREAADRALAALGRENPVERALIEALDHRYQSPVPSDRGPLDRAYAAAMERAWHQFPDDPDVGALFAESLMNLQPWDLWTAEGQPKGRVLEILTVLEKALMVSPNHPGANHFYIHAIEASPWPELGVPAAERLRTLVPGSGHLVHMPSHIFIRIGKYSDASISNQQAIAIDEAYLAAAPPPEFYNIYFLHNLHFLAYASMMEGRFEDAIQAARKIETQIPREFLKNYAAVADGFMPTTLHVLVRFGKWREILAEPEPDEWRLLSRAERHYARGVALANLGCLEEARAELPQLDRVAAQFTDDWKMGNNSARDVIAIARGMLEGEILFHSGQPEEAFAALRSAVRGEEQLAYDEPPGWMQPVRHALGALLLAGDRPAEAEQVYRDDLRRHPANAWSLLGLQQTLAKQGRNDEAKAMDQAVQLAWSRADIQPVASCFCHPAAQSPDRSGHSEGK